MEAHVPTGKWKRDPNGMGHKVLCIKHGSLSSTSEKAQEEPPAKLLDDLFRKTKAAPCIYWLPLTDSQVSAGLPALLRAAAQGRPRAESHECQSAEAQGLAWDNKGRN